MDHGVTTGRKYRLHGWTAIEQVKSHGGDPKAYGEDSAGEDRKLTLAEATELAGLHPERVYLDVDLCDFCLTLKRYRPAIMGVVSREFAGQTLCTECGASYESRMEAP